MGLVGLAALAIIGYLVEHRWDSTPVVLVAIFLCLGAIRTFVSWVRR